MKKQFSVLGLNNTFLDQAEPIIYNRSKNYVTDKHHRLRNAPYVDNSYKWAGGGFLSNVQVRIQSTAGPSFSYVRDFNCLFFRLNRFFLNVSYIYIN